MKTGQNIESGAGNPAPKPAVKIDHLKKSFGANNVLKDINLEIAKGENFGVMGKSGTGKSVLIKCMIRLIEADAGKIEMLGKSVPELDEDSLTEIRKKMGFLFQSSALYDSMTVRENIEFPMRELRADRKEKTERVEEALENVGLKDAIDKMPSELSGGMRKRVGLARTLILKPEIILYDEPTTGLDPITAREISTLILEMQEKYKATSVVITHDLECARLTTNRLILINEGMIVAEGTYQQLEDSKDTWVQSFLKGSKNEAVNKPI
jgi:phospholipid/cholesterol/gamma-HCH transport system ATP-binding protein